MNNEFVKRLTDIVEANLANETFGPDELVREVGMSHSSLNRKLKAISHQNASQFIREIRLKKAKELLVNEDLTVAEISYRVGFGSPTYFNKCFREYFGVTPGELRNHESESEPEKQPVELIPKKPKPAMILIGLLLSLMVLVPTIYFLFHYISISKAENSQEKSIALLPFKYLSDETEKQYLADGMMDAILLQLSKINDLRVISRTSVEQYRETDKTSKTIGQELDVDYVLEGSFLKDGDRVRLILQLINTSDDGHAWSNVYDRQWKDLFLVQSEVSETIAKELNAVITPEERLLIMKKPTNNLTAYDFYQRGNDELDKYEFKIIRDSITLKNAQHFFQMALELDTTFALAYAGLAGVQFWNSRKYYFSEKYLDSVLIFANKALVCDNQCSEAYYYRGYVFSQTSRVAEALKESDKALQFNPNNWKAYYSRHYVFEEFHDYLEAIRNLNEVVLRISGTGQPNFLTRFSSNLAAFGFPDLGKKYNQHALELYGDTTRYLYCLAYVEYCNENLEKAYQIAKSANKRDTILRSFIRDPDLSFYCMATSRYEEAYTINLKFFDSSKKYDEIDPDVSKKIAYYLWQTGRTKEAEIYFNQIIKYYQESIKLGRRGTISKRSQFKLAEVYALSGNKEKAYYYLDEVNKNQAFPLYWFLNFKYEPFFNSIRQEPRFQKILKDVEAKYQTEHERVRKWLVEEGIK